MAQPGTLIGNIPLPVGEVEDQGVSVATDCEGNIYYTLDRDTNLYVMDGAGTLLNTLPIATAAGAALNMDEMSWDGSRLLLWGLLHNTNPIDVYQINPTTGVATFAFTSATVSIATFRDGIAYDGSDDSLWISGDVSTTIEHYMTDATGTFINAITPKNSLVGDEDLDNISGVMVGVGNLLYLGQANGQANRGSSQSG